MKDNQTTPPSLQKLAIQALDIQDACNLSGVVHGFSRAMQHLCDRLRLDGEYQGTRSVNYHPIAVMWASKVSDLAGLGSGEQHSFGVAYRQCQEMAERPAKENRQKDC